MTVFPWEKDYGKSYLKADSLTAFCRDHMQWSQEEEEAAREKVVENSVVKVQWEDQGNEFVIA